MALKFSKDINCYSTTKTAAIWLKIQRGGICWVEMPVEPGAWQYHCQLLYFSACLNILYLFEPCSGMEHENTVQMARKQTTLDKVIRPPKVREMFKVLRTGTRHFVVYYGNQENDLYCRQHCADALQMFICNSYFVRSIYIFSSKF